MAWMQLVSITASLIVFSILERILNSLICTMWVITVGFGEGETKYGFEALQLLTMTASSGMRVVNAILNGVISGISSIFSWIFLAFIILFMTAMIYIVYEEHPVIVRGFALQWNSIIGPKVYTVLVLPIEAANLFFAAILPLYNTITWMWSRIVFQGFLIPWAKSPDTVLKAATSTALVVQTAANSLTAYSVQSFRDCNISTANSFEKGQCISDVGMRTLDLITPLTHLRDAIALLAGWTVASICGPLGAPLDILVAPMLDINIIKGIHNIINSVLWIFLQIPILTDARCRLFSEKEGVIMCIPDFEPAFRFLVEGDLPSKVFSHHHPFYLTFFR